MKKSDLVDALAAKASYLNKAQAQNLVEDLFDLISASLARGEDIDLRGFGRFTVRSSEARTGRNPQTGEPLSIPARKTPAFRPGKELKDRVNARS